MTENAFDITRRRILQLVGAAAAGGASLPVFGRGVYHGRPRPDSDSIHIPTDFCAEDLLDLPRTPTVWAAIDAYIYGIAPVSVYKKQHDQTHNTDTRVFSPLNTLYIQYEAPVPGDAIFVTPNVNVVYGACHMDLTDGPVCIRTRPNQVAGKKLYFVWEVLDAYTNAWFYMGSRATNGEDAVFCFHPPGTTEEEIRSYDDGYQHVIAPTPFLWIIARYQIPDSGRREGPAENLRHSPVAPYDEFDPDEVNQIHPKIPPKRPQMDIDGLAFFYRLNEWLTLNPPPAEDDPMLGILAEIGVGPGMDTDFNTLPASTRWELEVGLRLGRLEIARQNIVPGPPKVFHGGWQTQLSPDFGNFGTDYKLRAQVAVVGLAGNVNAEAVYYAAITTASFRLLSSGRNYVVRFRVDDLPPLFTPGFWSVTMYDRNTGTLVQNSIDRYEVGSQSGLQQVGRSFPIFIQQNPPSDPALFDNWLPSDATGDNGFYLIVRFYHPKPAIYETDANGQPAWFPPPVRFSWGV